LNFWPSTFAVDEQVMIVSGVKPLRMRASEVAILNVEPGAF